METRVNEAIEQAELQGRFLDENAFQRLKSYVEQGNVRIEIAQYLRDNAQHLIDSATQAVSQKFPYPAFNPDLGRGVERRQQGIKLCLQLIQYCILADDTSPIRQYIADSDTVKQHFNLTPSQLSEVLRHVKEQIGRESQQNIKLATEVTSYLDILIDIVLSELNSASESKGAVVSTSKGEGDREGWNGFEIPFWQRIADIGAQVPEEAWESLPKDMSRNGKHYLYGTPKEE